MRMKRLTGAMAPALLAALAVAGAGVPAAQAEAVKLKAASFLPERVIFAKHFYEWAAKVNEECAGEVEISVVGPAAVPSLEQWRALKTGVIDMHFGPPNYYKGEAIEADVTILAKNGAAEQKENGAWAMLNQLHNEKLNAWYLTHIHDGVNFFLYTSKPHQDGRFDGMRIRSVPIYDGFFRYLGADPVRMAPPDVGTALERGAVDGYGWPLWGVVDFGWHKFTKYRHGLGRSQRACLNRMTDWLDTEWPKWREAEGENQAKMLADAGVEYVDLGAEWAAKAESLYWESLEEASPEFTGKIRPLLE